MWLSVAFNTILFAVIKLTTLFNLIAKLSSGICLDVSRNGTLEMAKVVGSLHRKLSLWPQT